MGIIVFVLIAGTAAFTLYLSANIRTIIIDKVSEATQGAFDIDMGSIKVNLLGKNITVSNLRLSTDNDKLEDYNRNKGTFINPMDLNISSLALRGVRFSRKTPGAQSMEMQFPEMILTVDPDRQSNYPDSSDSPSHKKSVQKVLQEIGIGDIQITGGRFEHRKLSGSDTTFTIFTIVQGVNLRAEGLVVDSTGIRHEGKVLFCDDFTLRAESLTMGMADHSFNIEIDSIRAEGKAGTLSITEVRIVPRFSKANFAYSTPGHKDWLAVTTGNIECNSMDFDEILINKVVRMESLDIHGVNLATYKNRKISRNDTPKPMYHTLLHRLPIGLDIRQVNLYGLNAVYEELAEDGLSLGQISFNDITGTLTNMANTPEYYDKKLIVQAHGKLMNNGIVQATFTLPINPSQSTFTVNGNITDQNLPLLNKMITPLAYVEIESGDITRMDFSMTANDHNSSIDMVMLYDDLKVTILKNKGDELKERGFLSDLANWFVIKDSNPDRRGTREETATATRDPNRSPWNYIWKTMFPAIKKTVGLPDGKNR